jgi:hypothetical protein
MEINFVERTPISVKLGTLRPGEIFVDDKRLVDVVLNKHFTQVNVARLDLRIEECWLSDEMVHPVDVSLNVTYKY